MLDTSDLAKFPFTKEASRYVQEKGIEIEELARDYSKIVDAAVKRVEEAIEEEIHSESADDMVEILSYPAAVMIVMQVNDPFLKRRYALAEAKRAHKLLLGELPRKSKEHLMDIAVGTFKWDIQSTREKLGDTEYDFSLYFTDYLRNAAGVSGDKWKLVNRLVLDGRVYLTTGDAARLLQEEIRRRIENRLEGRLEVELPAPIVQRIEPLKILLAQRKGEIAIEEAPIGFMVMAFPPCIKKLYDAVFSGQNVPHLGRFTLTSFLLNTGMSPEEVVKLFSQLADFDSEMTRYQVEHIAGTRGSRTKYTPPNCSTLRTHGFCISMDDLCKKVRHPMSYYRRKFRVLKTGKPPKKG